MSFRDGAGRRRSGFGLVEIVVTLAVCGVLAAGLAAAVVAVSRLERTASDRAELLAASAHAGRVIGHELRALVPGSDALMVSPDSASLRAFRGFAVVCSADSTAAEIRYSGLRAPDVAKDSLLVTEGAGSERVLPLAGLGGPAPSCTAVPGEVALSVRPGSGLATGDVLLFFERGSYHLSSGSLRYRRGAGGRQPLTANVFLDDSTDFTVVSVSAPVPAVAAETLGVVLRTTAIGLDPRAPPGATLRYSPLLNLPIPLDSVPAP